jgi:hypothetical protein
LVLNFELAVRDQLLSVLLVTYKRFEIQRHLTVTRWRQCDIWIRCYRTKNKFFLKKSLWVSRVFRYPKKYVEDLTTFFMSTWWGYSKNMDEIEFSWWLFEGRLRQCKNVLPDGLNWLCYFAGSSKSHGENSISFIFFGIPSSSRHEKYCQILQTLFWVFQYSRNSKWNVFRKSLYWQNLSYFFISCQNWLSFRSVLQQCHFIKKEMFKFLRKDFFTKSV